MKNIKFISTISVSVLAVLFCSSATAQQPAPTGNNCADVTASVNQKLSETLKASVPKQDPATFNQNNYDIKGLMSLDVTSGFKKLMSMDFGSMVKPILDKGLDLAVAKSSSSFSNRMNDVLANNGVSAVGFEGLLNKSNVVPGVNVLPIAAKVMPVEVKDGINGIGNTLANPAGSVMPAISNTTRSIYSRAIP